MNKHDFDNKLQTLQTRSNYHSLILKAEWDKQKDCGWITYDPSRMHIDENAPDFNGSTTKLTDEEFVRANTLLDLDAVYRYPLDAKHIDIEKVYDAPGRPKHGLKGARADIIIRDDEGKPFAYFELKSPRKYISEKKNIESQLFQASKLDVARPKYLIWSTYSEENRHIEAIVISTEEFGEYADWQEAGEPSGNILPLSYGDRIKKTYAKVPEENDNHVPLSESSDSAFFSHLASELHDVIWGGGGTSNNEVFALITKLFLCKIYDEKEAEIGAEYDFQIRYSGSRPETSESVMKRMNALYRKAEQSYLAAESSSNEAFDTGKIKSGKIAYVVKSIEGISLTKNTYSGDLLGKFFEEIVSHGFTQTRGQFFTPMPIVDFMLELCGAEEQAAQILRYKPDGRGIHRMPRVIDPSCGVGTFLIAYMKKITEKLHNQEFEKTLSDRAREIYEYRFSGSRHTNWAQESLYGIENNHDLGLAAKVNMILHGDGSMNTFVKSGLLSFQSYQIKGREIVLSSRSEEDPQVNGQFDLVLSNPPFSISLTDDDKKDIKNAFSGVTKLSEDLFIERWTQLLTHENGRLCCILPESVFDTESEKAVRLYLISHYIIHAVVSLPYSTFQPYTSVKTCIIYAEKRTAEEMKAIKDAMKASGSSYSKPSDKLCSFLARCINLDLPVFMAEPHSVGYKRRKGLPDLVTRNDLPGVLKSYREGIDEPSLTSGFNTTLRHVLESSSFRLDPKYRWLHDIKNGFVEITGKGGGHPLGRYMSIVTPEKVHKGELDQETVLIDLDSVADKCGGVVSSSTVEEIQSDKISFKNCDLVFSRLEPYLAKCIINPDPDAIGTTEWVGVRCKNGVSPTVLGYFLALPQMREAMRMLQSGKRHARLKPQDLLKLKTDIELEKIPEKEILALKTKISELRIELENERANIDTIYCQNV